MSELPKRVLAIGAHPDDLEIQMGGTLAKYSALDCQVIMAVATDGSAGHMVIPANELAEIRHKEAQESADVIGADFYWLGFRDELIDDTIDTRLRFVELIRQTRPDVIFTHDPNDYHPDHRTVSKLVFDASFLSGLPNVKTNSDVHLGVQPLIYFDTSGGLNFQPSEYVDVTEVFKVKQTMFSKHVSQIQWLMDHDHIDIQRIIQVSGEYRGNQCSVALAEGFRPELCSPRLRTYRLLP